MSGPRTTARPGALAIGLLLAAVGASHADDGRADLAWLKSRCGDCHQLSAEATSGHSAASRRLRKAPGLESAGVKFRRAWLERWLSAPTRLRPAGFIPGVATETQPEGDRIDANLLDAHPALSATDAKRAADALLALDHGAERVVEGAYRKGALPRTMIELNFTKFKGCGACHRVAPDFGGVSGPELYTAFERLDPDYLMSFISDPQAWDRYTPMPGYGLDAAEAGKLVDYLRILSEEDR